MGLELGAARPEGMEVLRGRHEVDLALLWGSLLLFGRLLTLLWGVFSEYSGLLALFKMINEKLPQRAMIRK